MLREQAVKDAYVCPPLLWQYAAYDEAVQGTFSFWDETETTETSRAQSVKHWLQLDLAAAVKVGAGVTSAGEDAVTSSASVGNWLQLGRVSDAGSGVNPRLERGASPSVPRVPVSESSPREEQESCKLTATIVDELLLAVALGLMSAEHSCAARREEHESRRLTATIVDEHLLAVALGLPMCAEHTCARTQCADQNGVEKSMAARLVHHVDVSEACQLSVPEPTDDADKGPSQSLPSSLSRLQRPPSLTRVGEQLPSCKSPRNKSRGCDSALQ